MNHFYRYSFILLTATTLQAQPQLSAPQPQDIEDIRGIILLAGLEWWIYVLALAAMIGIGLLIYLLKRKKINPLPIESYKAKALRELAEARPLMLEGEARAFSLFISEILRNYLESHYHISVVQRTTEEFLQDIAKSNLLEMKTHAEDLNGFLHLCDQAKFGKEPLSLAEMETLWLCASRFIESTQSSTPQSPAPL